MIAYCVAASLVVLAVANFLIWRHWDRLHVPLPVSAKYGRPAACLLSVGLVLAPWCWTAVISHNYDAGRDALRAAHPFVSMEGRLPIPHVVATFETQRIGEYETYLEGYTRYDNYSADFAELHNNHVRTFSMLPGVGQMRMSSHIRKVTLPEPIPQPGVLRDDIHPTGDALPDATSADFFDFHAGSLVSFVNFKGFGYLRSRREVAGFVPHAFQHMPAPKPPYKLERLELVGLVRHPEPAVYVSEFLPRMAELDAVTTRPADGFETASLAKLAAGVDLVATITGSKVRLLGAVRNMAACVECHGGQRGDLLGAFSYRLAEAR